MANLTIGLLGVPESERAALISSVSLAGRAIGSGLQWVEADAAEICVLDVTSDCEPAPHQVAIRYTSDPARADAEFARPIRPTALMAALRSAVTALQAREAKDVGVRKAATAVYRGAPVEARPAGERTKSPPPPIRGLVYRGARVNR